MTGSTTTVGIEVRADGTQEAARDLAAVDASLQKIRTGLGGTVQPAGAAAQGLADVGASAKKQPTPWLRFKVRQYCQIRQTCV